RIFSPLQVISRHPESGDEQLLLLTPRLPVEADNDFVAGTNRKARSGEAIAALLHLRQLQREYCDPPLDFAFGHCFPFFRYAEFSRSPRRIGMLSTSRE